MRGGRSPTISPNFSGNRTKPCPTVGCIRYKSPSEQASAIRSPICRSMFRALPKTSCSSDCVRYRERRSRVGDRLLLVLSTPAATIAPGTGFRPNCAFEAPQDYASGRWHRTSLRDRRRHRPTTRAVGMRTWSVFHRRTTNRSPLGRTNARSFWAMRAFPIARLRRTDRACSPSFCRRAADACAGSKGAICICISNLQATGSTAPSFSACESTATVSLIATNICPSSIAKIFRDATRSPKVRPRPPIFSIVCSVCSKAS